MSGPSTGQTDGILSPHIKVALKAGSFTGLGGLVIGGAYGSVYSSTPLLLSIAYGLQCFAIGGIYWGSREFAIEQIGGQEPNKKVYASAAAGSVTGALMSLLTRRRSSFLPGVVVLAALGASSQAAFDMVDGRHSRAQETERKGNDSNVLQRLANSRWSPFKVLTDEEYGNMVRERILRLEAEIAVTEDEIKSVRSRSAVASVCQAPN